MPHHSDKAWFVPALHEMKRLDKSVFGPMAYQAYLRHYGLPGSGKRQTAAHISIDAFNLLPQRLRKEETMVLRLGKAPNSTETQFVLVRIPGFLKDFFLFDDEVFPHQGIVFMSSMTAQQLFPYVLLPSLTEGGLINFAFASGVLHRALCLDDRTPITPSTSQSTFTFDLKAHPSISNTFTHRSGQVEIDAMFVTSRNNHPTLFIVEAKADSTASLAKHKLLYPVLAVAPRVPQYMQVVPVYMRIHKDHDGYHFRIAECKWDRTPGTAPYVSGIQVVSGSHWILPAHHLT